MINKDIAFLVTDKTLRLSKNGISVMKSSEDHNYKKFIEMIKDKNVEYDIEDFTESKGFVNQNERFKVQGNDVYIDGELVSGSMSRHLHYWWLNGLCVDPIVAFWDNLKQMPTGFHDASGIWRDNPFYEDTKNSLLSFIHVHGYPITNDGHFLAEKTVRPDLGSIYGGGETKHIIGEITSMPRYAVNHDNSVACSYGLHVRSNRYNFGSSDSVVIVVKVNPKDVVSIPKDYVTEDKDGNVAADKMRVCAYRTMDIKGEEDLVQKFFEDDQKTKKVVTYVDIFASYLECVEYAWNDLKDRTITLETFHEILCDVIADSDERTDDIVDNFHLDGYETFADFEKLMHDVGVQ